MGTTHYSGTVAAAGFTVGGTSITAPRIDFSGATIPADTAGSLISTGTTWVAHSLAGQCALKLLTNSTAASGDFACARFRGRADAAGNAEGANASASAGANNYGNLCGVYAAGQPMAFSQASASSIVCGMHSVMDDATGGTSAGRRWSTWSDDHSIYKAAAGHYLHRLSSNGTVAIDGVWTIYGGGRCPNLFNFEDATPGFLNLSAKTITFNATDGPHTISFT